MEFCFMPDTMNIELFRWGQIVKHCDHFQFLMVNEETSQAFQAVCNPLQPFNDDDLCFFTFLGFCKGHGYSPTLQCYLCYMGFQTKYVIFLFHICLGPCLTAFSQLYSGRHGNECFLRAGILFFLLQRMKWREGERKDMHFFSPLL